MRSRGLSYKIFGMPYCGYCRIIGILILSRCCSKVYLVKGTTISLDSFVTLLEIRIPENWKNLVMNHSLLDPNQEQTSKLQRERKRKKGLLNPQISAFFYGSFQLFTIFFQLLFICVVYFYFLKLVPFWVGLSENHT